MRRPIARHRGCKDALFERDVFGQPVAVRPASSRTPRCRAIGRRVMACHDRMRLAWMEPRQAGRGKNSNIHAFNEYPLKSRAPSSQTASQKEKRKHQTQNTPSTAEYE